MKRLSLLLTSLFLAPALATKCYNLDGSEAKADVPCSSSGTSNCCNSGDLCMSNGLCYIQGPRGFSLSRGSCTDKDWGAKCYAPCSNTNRNSGYPIVNVGFDGNSTKFCCGAVTDDKGSCLVGNSFTLGTGTAVPGFAGLAGYSKSSSSNPKNTSSADSSSSTDSFSSDDSSNSRDVAIGAGVGVPLGVIALASIAWALWERRGRTRALAQGTPMVAQGQPAYQEYRPPVELAGPPLLELGEGNKPHIAA